MLKQYEERARYPPSHFLPPPTMPICDSSVQTIWSNPTCWGTCWSLHGLFCNGSQHTHKHTQKQCTLLLSYFSLTILGCYLPDQGLGPQLFLRPQFLRAELRSLLSLFRHFPTCDLQAPCIRIFWGTCEKGRFLTHPRNSDSVGLGCVLAISNTELYRRFFNFWKCDDHWSKFLQSTAPRPLHRGF